MTVDFAPNWYMASWSAEGCVSQSDEKALILEMIGHSDSAEVQQYAQSDMGAVYVIAGIHRSKSDASPHATVRLGINSQPYSSTQWPAFTAHIYYKKRHVGYPTQLYPGHGKFNVEDTIKGVV